MLSSSSLLLLLLAIPSAVRGRCVGTTSKAETCGSIPPSSCHGFTPQFCQGMQSVCNTKCAAEGCSCDWTQVGFLCQTGSSSCRWKGQCVKPGSSVSCASLSTEATCTGGCTWIDDDGDEDDAPAATTNTPPQGQPTNITVNNATATATPPPPPPLKLNNTCFDQIETLGTCLDTSRTSQCLDCTLGRKGIVVPPGGFRTCRQVRREYCKPGTSTLAPGGFLTDCCGSCQDEVLGYLKCLYGCPALTCAASTAAVQEFHNTSTTSTTTQTVARNNNPNLRRHHA